MVSFKGTGFAKLHKAFLDEFNVLWSLERKNDKPVDANLSYYTTVNNGSLPIHSTKPISLSFEEIMELRASVNKIAPDFLRQMNRKTSSCQGFDVTKKQLWGCQ